MLCSVVVVVVVIVHLSIYLPVCLSVYIYIYIYIHIIYIYISLSIYLSIFLSIFLSIYLSLSLKTELFCETSSVVELDNVKNETILRDFLSFWTWQCQKRSGSATLNCWTWQHQERNNSARRPQFSTLTASKTKQFCETSFENGKLSAELTASYQCVLLFFNSTCLKHCARHEKVMAGHTKCCTCHAKSSQQTWRSDLMLQNVSPLSKSAPGPPNSSDEHVSCFAPATETASLQILCICPTLAIDFGHAIKSSRFAHFWILTRCTIPCACHAKRHLNVQKCSEPVISLHFWLGNVLRATTAYTFSTSKRPKVLRNRQFFTLLTWKCASRHNSVHFFDISTSKKKSEPVSFFTLLTWKCASRHSSVQLFISHLTTWLRTRRFSEPTFRPSWATNHWKNTVFRDFPTFSHTWIFFLRRLYLFWSSFFFSSLLWLFPPLLFICPYCWKFDF